ncbi:MAG: hypothetical protein WDZ80_03605 [Candidatus Paceibacterota bacterium]
MSLKTDLKIKIYAGNVLVAESSNPTLWHKVLGVIQSGETENKEDNNISDVTQKSASTNLKEFETEPIEKLAKKIGVKKSELKAACDPNEKEPFIYLDPQYWESFKKNTPSRGPKAVSPIQLTGTILYLWFEIIEKGRKPSQAEAKAVLKTINVRDSNATRALNNCDWLQNRNGAIQINPARYSQALAVAKAYITKNSIED